ncbi:MAG: class E sortase [Actinomycetes bacterium]
MTEVLRASGSGTRSIRHDPVGPVRRAIGLLGEVLITSGVLILLFVVYQLFWTNVTADQAAAAQTSRIEAQWAAGGPAASGVAAGGSAAVPPIGSGVGLMFIPRLGDRWVEPVLQGVSLTDLAQGVGHYPQTALPGQVGNFAIAGHRATHGQPFAYLDQLVPGDKVYVETRASWYTYVVDRMQIVLPTDVGVILPVPGQPGVAPSGRLITLTTCNPRWGSWQRLIWFGHLVSVTSKADSPPPAAVAWAGNTS